MGLTYPAIDSAWAQMGGTTKVYSSPAGKERFNFRLKINKALITGIYMHILES